MNRQLLANWIEAGLAVRDLGDGAWGWIEKGLDIPPHIRCYLGDLLYGRPIPSFMYRSIREAGFDPKTGYYIIN